MFRFFFLLLPVFFFVFMSFEAVNAKPKTFIYCSEGSPSNFNPQLTSDGPSFNASSRMIYNRLVDFKSGGTEIIPSLASSWKISDNGLEYTFHLRTDVPFQKTDIFNPQRNFNADDVIWTFHRMLKSDHPYHEVGGGRYEYFKSMEMDQIIKEIVKINDSTVKFILKHPEAPFLADMAMDSMSILSAEYANQLLKTKTPGKIDTNPVGTGPFVFKRYQKDSFIKYEAHDQYFMGRPQLDQVVFSITQDPSVRLQKLKTGECHLIAEPSPTDLPGIKNNSQLRLVEGPGLNVGYIAMNTEKKPFDNPLVRKAFNHALNRDAYIKTIYLGNAQKAINPLPPSIWAYSKNIQDYSYDPELARKLLHQAGIREGLSVELWTLPVSRPYLPSGKKLGEMIQSDLAQIGVKVTLVTYDWPTYLAQSRKGAHQLIELGWTGDNGDPDNFLSVLLSCAAIKAGSNVARWCSTPFGQWIEKAKKVSDQKKRTYFYFEAQKIFKQEAPWVTLAHATVYRALRKEVKGYQLSPFGTENFYNVDLDQRENNKNP